MSFEQEDLYFSELLGYSLDRLSKEPELLAADIEALKDQQAEATVAQYPAFIEAAKCTEELRTQLIRAARGLDALIADLPNLKTVGEGFRAEAATNIANRTNNRRLVDLHPVVLELLEVPQLMETCVRAGYFDEALDLRSFATKLYFLHGEVPIVAKIAAEAEVAADVMKESLLARLSGAVQLPDCLRTVGYLRRLASFEEKTLRRSFLEARERWIAGLVHDLDDSHSYDYLKRLTDVYRLHLFDVAMQYRAIFTEESCQDGGILFSWAQQRVTLYLNALDIHLPQIRDGGGLASVLDHAMHAGSSLGRVGLDFRPLIAPYFEKAILTLFTRCVDASTTTFLAMLDSHKWISMPTSSARSSNVPGEDLGALPPPASLMEHVPLAIYVNGLLAAFNELRHCAVLCIESSAAASLQSSLASVATALKEHGATRSLSVTELAVYEAACSMYTSTLCPYITACYERLYGHEASEIHLQKILHE